MGARDLEIGSPDPKMGSRDLEIGSRDLEIGSPDPKMGSRALQKWPPPWIQPPAPASLRCTPLPVATTPRSKNRRKAPRAVARGRRVSPTRGIAVGTAIAGAVRTLAMKTRAMRTRMSEAVPKRRDRRSLRGRRGSTHACSTEVRWWVGRIWWSGHAFSRGRRGSTHACSRDCSFHVPACLMDLGRCKKNRTQKYSRSPLSYAPQTRFFKMAGRLRDPAQSKACKHLPIPPPFPRLRCSDSSVGQPFRRYRTSKKEKMCLQAVRIGNFSRQRIICSLF